VARKNRIVLLILLASFVIPFVVGDLAYRLGWYQGGQTNKGQLIDPPVGFAELHGADAGGKPVTADFAGKHWWLLYVVPADCDVACRNRLFQMRQVRKALGREEDRVRQLLVFTSAPSSELDALLEAEFKDFVRITARSAAVDSALQRLLPDASGAGQLYIMDPLGWIMLAYPPEADEKTSVVKAEDVLQDLKKLLKASRIG
jgi:cytochrome oxidase Cu insertion factor (SCO1/SenC/PrrC family)